MEKAIAILKSEHRSISAVLQALKDLARRAQDTSVRPSFQALRSLVRYIDEFPEQLHHPKEDKYLFARLLARAPHLLPLVKRLTTEHEEGARLIRELERAVLLFEESWPAGARQFQVAVEDYARFHWDHMRVEENELLPLAQQHLSQEDWKWVDEAFAGNKDPLLGVRDRDYQRLFTRIVGLAPAPVGLGEPWKKASG